MRIKKYQNGGPSIIYPNIVVTSLGKVFDKLDQTSKWFNDTKIGKILNPDGNLTDDEYFQKHGFYRPYTDDLGIAGMVAPGPQQAITAIKGIQQAEKLAESKVLLNSANNTAKQYNRFNSIYRIAKPKAQPTSLSAKHPSIKMVDTFETVGNSPTEKIDNVGGMWRKKWNDILIKSHNKPISKKYHEANAFHEGLHSIGYGEGPQNVWKAKYLFGDNYEKIPEYYRNGYETAVHSLTQGKLWGIEPGTPYPGDEAFFKLLETYGRSGAPYYFKINTLKDRLRFWNAITGQFFKQGGILRRK